MKRQRRGRGEWVELSHEPKRYWLRIGNDRLWQAWLKKNPGFRVGDLIRSAVQVWRPARRGKP